MINLDFFDLNVVFDYIYQIFDIFGQLANTPWQDIYDFCAFRLDSITLSSSSIYGFNDLVYTLEGWFYQLLALLGFGPVYIVQDILLNMFHIPTFNLTLWQALLLSTLPLSFCFFFIGIIKKVIGIIA